MAHRAALLVAASGGHLDQMTWLAPRLWPQFDTTLYVTSESDHSCSLLRHERVCFVPPVPPRGAGAAARAVGPAVQLMRREGITDVVSTGSAIAVPYLLAARLLGLRAHYVESAARTEGPSLTGKLVRRIPGVHLYAQYAQWADQVWSYQGSVLEGFAVGDDVASQPHLDRVVVTLGTMSQYPFDRALRAVQRVLTPFVGSQTEFLWQIGDVPSRGLPGEVQALLPADRLWAAMHDADLVVAHAGVGSALQILDAGRMPLLLPRARSQGEHVDDHQQLIADELTARGLAVTADPDELSADHIRRVLGRRVVRCPHTADFQLAV